jgi:hypothetical protein
MPALTGFWRIYLKMDVVVHQAIAEQAKATGSFDLGEDGDELLAVMLVHH